MLERSYMNYGGYFAKVPENYEGKYWEHFQKLYFSEASKKGLSFMHLGWTATVATITNNNKQRPSIRKNVVQPSFFSPLLFCFSFATRPESCWTFTSFSPLKSWKRIAIAFRYGLWFWHQSVWYWWRSTPLSTFSSIALPTRRFAKSWKIDGTNSDHFSNVVHRPTESSIRPSSMTSNFKRYYWELNRLSVQFFYFTENLLDHLKTSLGNSFRFFWNTFRRLWDP